jgi:Endoplasmic reticulum vesicle transporter
MKNPLENDIHAIQNDAGGIALTDVQVKVIPTRYQGFLSSRDQYQLSVTEHIIQPETLASQGSRFLPGLAVSYDFTPLAVHHVEARDNIFVFLSSLISIVGGVFVTVSLLTGCLVHSAAAIAKKID